MGVYSRKGQYFGAKQPGFTNTCWIELIGFDNTSPDYGVQDFIDKCGFAVDRVSFHLTSLDFVNTHRGMDREYKIPKYACSYSGHEANDDRRRQNWTNYQMRGLVDSLHAHGVEVFASFFDLENSAGCEDLPDIFSDEHPELKFVDRDGHAHQFLYMLKHFADGTAYLDYLKPRLIQTAKDYGLDGIQLADGISSPRCSLERGDYSDETVHIFLESEGLTLPDDIPNVCDTPEKINKRADYIYTNLRSQWIRHLTGRWRHFMTELIQLLNQNGLKASFNSAWTKDPLEAIYRYGADYQAYAKAGVFSFVVEDVSADLAILAEDENGYHMGYDHRKFVHYEFLANLMCNKAAMPDLPMTPLFMIRDTLEQWDVLHHVPQAMQRAACGNLSSYLVHNGKITPVTSGPWFCLADGLTRDEWNLVRAAWDNAYIPEAKSLNGFTLIWSDARMHNELNALIQNRTRHTARYLAELLGAGAPVRKIARIGELDSLTGDIIVPNPALLPEDELKAIAAYSGGRKAYIGLLSEGMQPNVSSVSPWGNTGFCMDGASDHIELVSDEPMPENAAQLPELVGGIWTHPLRFAAQAEGFIDKCAELMRAVSDVPKIEGDHGACRVHAVELSNGKLWCCIENEEYYYALPTVHFGRPVKSIELLTKPDGYPQQRCADGIRLRVPGRGADVMEVTFE